VSYKQSHTITPARGLPSRRKKITGWLAGLARPAARAWVERGYFQPTPPENPKSVAIVACHWIGDSLWAAQTLSPLHEYWPDAEWRVYVKPSIVDLWRGFLPGDRIVSAPAIVSDRRRERVSWRELFRFAREERGRGFDAVVDLTGNRYSAWFSFLLRPRFAIGFDGGEWGSLYSRRVSDAERPGRLLAERPFRVIEPVIGRFAFRESLLPPMTASFGDVAARMGFDPRRPLGVLAPGANWEPRRWAVGNFREVGRRLVAAGWQVAVTGSPREKELCERATPPGGVALPGLPLADTFALLSGCAGFFGNNSGLTHIAAVLGRPVAAIFTDDAEVALYRPLGPRVRVFPATAEATSVIEFGNVSEDPR